ncbi:uncharacterized protein TNCV_2828521 [Trichonephila clavipes]|nr:uncharacterized protein TNCV_2828521 [Trichonephila clavipes]
MATPLISTSTILPWDWREGKYSPVPCTHDSAHKAFGPTDLTSTYTRAFGDGPVILNHGQVTWATPELAPPLLTTTPHQREDVSALDRFNVHRCPTRRVFSGTGLEPVTKQATVRYLYHSATAAMHRASNPGLPVWSPML